MNNWSNAECICTEQKLINYTPYLYLHSIFTLFIQFIFLLYLLLFIVCIIHIFYCIYLYLFFYLSYLFIYLFCSTVFLTQCVSLFVDKHILLFLLLHNLTFSCPRSQDDDPVRDDITNKIKVYVYNNNNTWQQTKHVMSFIIRDH